MTAPLNGQSVMTPEMRATLQEQIADIKAKMDALDAPAKKPRVRVPAQSRPLPDPAPGIATRAIDKPFRYASYAS